jgi:uncharacterized membrane protein
MHIRNPIEWSVDQVGIQLFLGLIVVMPVIGHAALHLYRRVVLAAS